MTRGRFALAAAAVSTIIALPMHWWLLRLLLDFRAISRRCRRAGLEPAPHVALASG